MSQSTTPCRSTVFEELRHAFTHVAVLHHESPRVVLRRRIVVGITLVIGAVLLGRSLRQTPGVPGCYQLLLLVALVWGVGAFASGPLHLGGICWRGRNQRPVITGTTIGLLLGGCFVLGALVARKLVPVTELIAQFMQFAHQGSFPLVVSITLASSVAEELFFRGALYTAVGRHHPVAVSTILYAGTVLTSGNLALGFAALVLGTVCAVQRRITGGILAPMLTHFVWSLIMVLMLPALFVAV